MMSPKQLEMRKRWLLTGEKSHSYQYVVPPKRRAYEKGDIRCTNCHKWINPHNEEEAQEIRFGKGGKMMHKDCPVRAINPSQFITRPRFHGTRRKWLALVKRY